MPLTSLTSTINPSQLNKNYIPNGQLENNSTAGWSLFTTTLTSGLPTGTLSAGASTLSLSTTSTSPLFQSYSLLLSSSGAVTAGQGLMSDPFTIDRTDLAKPLTFRIYYEAITGSSNANWSGIVGSQSFAVYLYDVTNSAWVQPAGAFGMNQSVGPAYVTGTFQTSSTSGQQYRLILMCLQATTGAISLEIDEVSVTPQTAPLGSVSTDWVTYPLTITGSVTNPIIPTSGVTVNVAKYRRIGDSIQIQYNYESSTVSGGNNGSGDYFFSLPAGLSPDTNKLAFNGGANAVINGVSRLVTPGGSRDGNMLVSTAGKILGQYEATGTDLTTIGSTATLFTSNNSQLTFFCTIPVAGWGSNVQLSNDTDTRVVSLSLGGSASQSIGTSTDTKFVGMSVNFDTHGGWSTSTNSYIVPVSGFYRISCAVSFATVSSAVGQSHRVVLYRGVSSVGTIAMRDAPSNEVTSVTTTFHGSNTFSLNAGDVLSLYGFQTGATRNMNMNWTTIERLSGPSVIAATETVACRYVNTAGTPIGTSSATIPFATKSYDTHNAFNGTTFTVPVSGKYLITARIGAVVTSSAISLEILKAGVRVSFMRGQGNVSDTMVTIVDQLDLIAGDLITFAGNIANASTLVTGAGFNSMTIVRVGN